MAIDKLTDLALRAGQGDEIAMDELLPIVMKRARGLARKELWCGSDEDIEDLSQDILYGFLKGVSTFQGRSYFNLWFYRIARNVAITKYRTAATMRRQPVFIEQQEYYEPNYDYIECEQFIGICTDKQQQVMMYYLDGNDYSQIASKMDASYEAVRSLYRNGIKQMKAEVTWL